MKNIRAYIITVSRVKEARAEKLYLPLSLPFLPSPRFRGQRLSPPRPSPSSSPATLLPLPPLLSFSSPLSESYARAKTGESEVPLETRSCNCIPPPPPIVNVGRARARARTYGKSSQLALITLKWSTINSRNLPLNLGHGYRVLRNSAAIQLSLLHLTDDVARKSEK